MPSSDEEMDFKPPDIISQANTSETCLPPKSKEKYLSSYENFLAWKGNKKAKSFSEDVFLTYFNEIANKYKPNSLWSIYSMLKTTVRTRNGVDMKKYSNLLAFLKKRSHGFKSQKPLVFSRSHIERFLKDAPDDDYLVEKVALIFGVNGACTPQELCDITTNNIEYHGQLMLLKLTHTRNNVPRSFIIDGPFLDIVKKYESLRNSRAKHERFFQNYQKGKCTRQPIGVNKFGAMPQKIARFLGLEKPEMYTGRSFRRTSTTSLVNCNANILNLNRHDHSNTESDIEESVEQSNSSLAKPSLETKSNGDFTEPRLSVPFNEDPLASTSRNEVPHTSTSCSEDSLPSTSYNEEWAQPPNSFDFTPSPTHAKDAQSNENNVINNEIINNIIAQSSSGKPNNYYFYNCTFTNCSMN